MKKVIALVLVFVMVFFACSCGKNGGGNSPEEEKYVFKSSETQKVYKNNNNYMIFYYKNDTVTGIDTVMTFQTEEAAISSLEVLQKAGNDNSEIVREGKFIVMHMNDAYLADYLKMTGDGIESYLKAQGYVLVEKIEEETTAEQKTEKPTEKVAEETTAAPKK